MARRILVLDGAMGTMLQRLELNEDDFRGERFRHHPTPLKGNSDLLVLTRPDAVASIHSQYFEAGADIVETNTFTATTISQADYGLASLAYELNVEGARVARRVADEWTARTPDRSKGDSAAKDLSPRLTTRGSPPPARGRTVPPCAARRRGELPPAPGNATSWIVFARSGDPLT